MLKITIARPPEDHSPADSLQQHTFNSNIMQRTAQLFGEVSAHSRRLPKSWPRFRRKAMPPCGVGVDLLDQASPKSFASTSIGSNKPTTLSQPIYSSHANRGRAHPPIPRIPTTSQLDTTKMGGPARPARYRIERVGVYVRVNGSASFFVIDVGHPGASGRRPHIIVCTHPTSSIHPGGCLSVRN